jgi:hypothetical protein
MPSAVDVSITIGEQTGGNGEFTKSEPVDGHGSRQERRSGRRRMRLPPKAMGGTLYLATMLQGNGAKAARKTRKALRQRPAATSADDPDRRDDE